MRIFVTDYEAVLRVRAPFRWHRFPGSALHGMLKSALDRVDPGVRAHLLAPVVAEPSPHFCLRAGDPAPAALLPVLPQPGTGPGGTLMPGDHLQVRLRRLGRADRRIDQCIEDALECLDEALVAEQVGRRGPRERLVEVDERATRDTRISLKFITPGHLKSDGRVRVDLDFPTLIGLIRRRLEVLCVLHGELPADSSERFRREILPGAREVTCARSRLRSEEWERATTRPDGSSGRHRMVGLLGDVEFEGPVGAFVPTLVAAQEIHVGKLTSMGLGRVALAFGPDGAANQSRASDP